MTCHVPLCDEPSVRTITVRAGAATVDLECCAGHADEWEDAAPVPSTVLPWRARIGLPPAGVAALVQPDTFRLPEWIQTFVMPRCPIRGGWVSCVLEGHQLVVIVEPA